MSEREKTYKTSSLPSAEVEEIMGQVPPAVLRYGMTIIILVLLMFGALSWFLKYPDEISGQASITTEVPPASIVSRIDDRILQMRVGDSSIVDSSEILMVLGNATRLEDLELWQSYLLNLDRAITCDSLWLIANMLPPSGLNLSSLQTGAASVTARWNTYSDLLEKEARFDQAKAEALHQRIREQEQLIRSLSKQLKLLQEEGRLVRSDFRRDSLLALSGGIAAVELEEARKKVLKHQMSVEDIRSRIAEVSIRKGEYQQQLADFLSTIEQSMHQSLVDLGEVVGQALGAYSEWERQHILRSPVRGRVSLASYWSVGQEVKQGDVLLHILPESPGEIIGKLKLPLRGSGLVGPGNEVRISIQDYPPMEYGVLLGEIDRVSAIPEGELLLADIRLKNGLTTTYGTELEFRGSLSGQAEVVTHDARLIERVIRPLKYLLKHETGR